MERSLARQTAVALLYERLSGGEVDEESVRMVLDTLPKHISKLANSDKLFLNGMLDGVEVNEDALRQTIAAHLTEDWTMERLNRIDLCILLLASFEILHTDTPDGIVISEALKLADLFTEPKNKRFINAVLGAISRDHAKDND